MKQHTAPQPIASIPNFITCTGLLSGILSIIFSFKCSHVYGNLSGYQWTWIFIGISVVCDFCDGFCARMLGAYSELGKNLDSLSDLITFGVAPCTLIFNLIEFYHPNWAFVTWLPLLMVVTGALRLAKFNIDPSQKEEFKGLPIPANAIFWIGFSPLLVLANDMPAWVATFAILFISLLMVIPVPMFSLKVSEFNFSIDNLKRVVLIIASILLLIFVGIQGFMWSIILYILISFVSYMWVPKN